MFEIRLITTEYRNHLEWEDGPGSLQNVVSDTRSWVQDVAVMTLAEAESLDKVDLEERGFYFEEDSSDGFEEYSFKLEYLDPAMNKWRLVKFL